MATVTVSDEYTDIFAPLGDVHQVVDEALKRYAVEKISEQIADLRRQICTWEKEYGCSYETFYARVTADEDYVAHLRQVSSTWEWDFQQWEFYMEELREWIARLESISRN